MLLHLSDQASEPLHEQISRQLRGKILSGELLVDTALPSIRGLARMQRVSVITVQRSYDDIEREGLIHSRRGKGFFVSDISPEQKLKIATERLRDHIEPMIDEAIATGLSSDQIKAVVESILEEKG